ncbi:RDD family protein [Anaerorhabdus sp.]|uniref:RDD family protein n=1 Tax=Anaerorhabdus sp. TaxID=1872524 RepID=UPI002B21FBAB|nr:RDD family protein [Anaerorhabdus sp.]MEA4874411.1 RDD family protein [Anaerorhabdus sp.]
MDNLLVKRISATFIDIVVVIVPTGILYGIVLLCKLNPAIKNFVDQISISIQVSLLFMIVYCVYDFVYNYKFHTTIGKNVKKVHIETLKGRRRIPPKRLLIRSIIKSISLFSLYAVPAVISVLLMTNDYGTSLHDKAARTSVWENMVG